LLARRLLGDLLDRHTVVLAALGQYRGLDRHHITAIAVGEDRLYHVQVIELDVGRVEGQRERLRKRAGRRGPGGQWRGSGGAGGDIDQVQHQDGLGRWLRGTLAQRDGAADFTRNGGLRGAGRGCRTAVTGLIRRRGTVATGHSQRNDGYQRQNHLAHAKTS